MKDDAILGGGRGGDADEPGQDWVEGDLGSAKINSLVSRGYEGYGTPQVKATTYICKSGNHAVLSQDAIWKEGSKPYCPEHDCLLEKPE